jgi:nitrate/nitrite transport system permease protein
MTANFDNSLKKPNFLVSLLKQPPRKLLAPVCAILFILALWQVLCGSPDANLPSPLKTLQETSNLIFNPFFDNGGTDKGLFWQIIASLQRVAIGYTLAALVGIGLGILIGSNAFMYDAVDPIFQVLRTIPPLAGCRSL